MSDLVQAIDALLPQTQCQRCDYPGCLPYAQAIVDGEADINRCAPGGIKTQQALSALTGKSILPLAPERQAIADRVKQSAHIDPDACIGCAMCLRVCPTDAIVGAAKQLHVVLTDDCTGCDLCLPTCPVDCIEMRPLPGDLPTWIIDNPEGLKQASAARKRHQQRQAREAQLAEQRAQQRRSLAIKRDIKAAIARAKAKKDGN